ncbi:MAG: hypothetical protein IMF11_20175 [Proteobacteria bacterium]|nr:hypothetical protein [Pseudomonadota bacterium]
MKEEHKSPYKDCFLTTDLVKAIIRQDRAIRFKWQQHPEEMPEDIKRAVRMARVLNRRVKAQVRAEVSAKK